MRINTGNFPEEVRNTTDFEKMVAKATERVMSALHDDIQSSISEEIIVLDSMKTSLRILGASDLLKMINPNLKILFMPPKQREFQN